MIHSTFPKVGDVSPVDSFHISQGGSFPRPPPQMAVCSANVISLRVHNNKCLIPPAPSASSGRLGATPAVSAGQQRAVRAGGHHQPQPLPVQQRKKGGEGVLGKVWPQCSRCQAQEVLAGLKKCWMPSPPLSVRAGWTSAVFPSGGSGSSMPNVCPAGCSPLQSNSL